MAQPDAEEVGTIESAVLKGFFVGTAVGSVLVFVLWGGVALIGGFEPFFAGAIGVFTTAWGGPGFGGMLGAVMGYVRYEERVSHRNRSSGIH